MGMNRLRKVENWVGDAQIPTKGGAGRHQLVTRLIGSVR